MSEITIVAAFLNSCAPGDGRAHDRPLSPADARRQDALAWARRSERAAELEGAGFTVGTLEKVLAHSAVVNRLRIAPADGTYSGGNQLLVAAHSVTAAEATALVRRVGADPR